MSTSPAKATERNRDELDGHVCVPPANHTCDGQQGAGINHHARKAHARQQCATVPNILGTTQPGVAQSATESSASFGASAGEPPTVRRSALTASGRARKATADGCVDFTPPDNGRGEARAVGFRCSGAYAMILLCKLLLGSCLCGVLATRGQAQDGQGQAGLHHHPPQDQLLHEKFYSTWRMPDNPSASCCNDADCYPAEIKYVDGNIYAKRREDGKYIPIPPEKVERNRDNPDGRNHLCAPPPNVFHQSDTVFCFALGGAT
jgi:hypothetical protein